MTAEVTEEVKKKLEYVYKEDMKRRLQVACLAGVLTTVKGILSDHPDSIHAKIGRYGNVFSIYIFLYIK